MTVWAAFPRHPLCDVVSYTLCYQCVGRCDHLINYEGHPRPTPRSSQPGLVPVDSVLADYHTRGPPYKWLYSIEISEAKTINHPVFGEIEVVPILEKREILGGRYHSTLDMLVYPELGIGLRFSYKDGKRDYECDLVSYD